MNNLFDHFANQLDILIQLSKQNLVLTFYIVGAFWIIHLVNFICRYQLNRFGVYPRHVIGLRGIIFSPFLHGHFDHLLFNTVPLFILVNLTLMYGMDLFLTVSLVVIVCSGLAVWLFARPGMHVGASGLIMGYWGFLLAEAFYHPNISAVIVAALCLYYLGGLFFSIVPSAVGKNVSWEAHLFGCLAGIGVAASNDILIHFS